MTTNTVKIEGYVIARTDGLEMGVSNFEKTIGGAWLRFIGVNVPKIDRSRHIQEWSKRGWKPFKASIVITE